jgi:DNA-binding XRE family transcriptional regulator
MVDEAVDVTVGVNVRKWRESLGLSQAELARHVGEGFQQQTIVKIEKGVRPLRLSEAVRIAQVFAIDVKDLYASDAGRIQLLGIFQLVRVRYDEMRESTHNLEDARLDMVDIAQKCEQMGGPLPPDLRKAIDELGREDLAEMAIGDARGSGLLRLKREAMGLKVRRG